MNQTLTKEDQARIAELIRQGMSLSDACAKAQSDSGNDTDLLTEVARASADFKQSQIDAITKAASEEQITVKEEIVKHADGSETKKIVRERKPASWQAAKWLLETKYPDEFKPTAKTNLIESQSRQLALPFGGTDD